jgi:hypothetical protein
MSGPTDTDAPAQDEQEIRYVQSRPATSGVVNAGAGRFVTRRSSQPSPPINTDARFTCSNQR